MAVSTNNFQFNHHNGTEDENVEDSKLFHAIVEPLDFTCSICKHFKSDYKLSIHKHFINEHCQSTKNVIEIREFLCEHCSLLTNSTIYFTIHQNNYKEALNSTLKLNREVKVPSEITWFNCEYCSYKVKRKKSLKVHVTLKHTPSGEIRWLYCEKCSYEAKTASGLSRHRKLRHTLSDKIKCDKCSYVAKNKDVIKKHMKHRHAPEVVWAACGQCPFKTKHQRNLKVHVLNRHTSSDKIEHWFHCKRCLYKTQVKERVCEHFTNLHASSDEDDSEQYFTESRERGPTELDGNISSVLGEGRQMPESKVNEIAAESIPSCAPSVISCQPSTSSQIPIFKEETIDAIARLEREMKMAEENYALQLRSYELAQQISENKRKYYEKKLENLNERVRLQERISQIRANLDSDDSSLDDSDDDLFSFLSSSDDLYDYAYDAF